MIFLFKRCFNCGKEQEISAFYKHSRMADGHLNKCISCCKEQAKMRREMRLDEVRKYDRDRGHRQPPEYQREYRRKFPERNQAHLKVKRAIKSGKLVKEPCFICGDLVSEAHHPDYSAPLAVVWLCSAHHRQAHLNTN